MPATLLMPLTRPETAAQNPSSKSDSDSTTNKDTTNLSSLPPNMPAAVIDMIESKKDVIPVEWYNCTLTSSRFLRDTNLSKHFPRHANGRWTFSNLPECGVSIFEDYVPMIKIVPDPHPTEQAEQAEQISKIPVATSRSGCCQVQYMLPCVCCALRMQDGDYRALCRRDPEIKNTETCTECAYARQTCTRGGFRASEEGVILVEAREIARVKMINLQLSDDKSAIFALNAMQTAAAQYLAAIWSHGSVYDLIKVQCLYNSSRVDGPTSSKMTKTKKKTKRLKEKDGKHIQKRTGKDVGVSQFLNQGSGLAMARNMMIREMLTYNREISETLQKNSEISETLRNNKNISEMLQQNKKILEMLQQNNEMLKKLLGSPAEGK
ncbi:hypothetical protein HDV64DRAFT_278140 [Trichoderma sp. TUCIM 5745]